MSKAKLKIKKGDQVVVLTGKDKGAKGEVLKTLPAENRVIVQGVNVVKKHQRPTQFSQGGKRNCLFTYQTLHWPTLNQVKPHALDTKHSKTVKRSAWLKNPARLWSN